MNSDDKPDDALPRSLERLALAEWSEAAEARVDSVVVVGDRAGVILLLNGDYEYSVYFQPDPNGAWQEAGSSSGRVDSSTLAALDRE